MSLKWLKHSSNHPSLFRGGDGGGGGERIWKMSSAKGWKILYENKYNEFVGWIIFKKGIYKKVSIHFPIC